MTNGYDGNNSYGIQRNSLGNLFHESREWRQQAIVVCLILYSKQSQVSHSFGFCHNIRHRFWHIILPHQTLFQRLLKPVFDSWLQGEKHRNHAKEQYRRKIDSGTRSMPAEAISQNLSLVKRQ